MKTSVNKKRSILWMGLGCGALLFFAAGLWSCGFSPMAKEAGTSLFAMDTYMSLSAYGADADAAIEEASAKIHRLEKLLSTNIETSEVAAINRGEDVALSDDTAHLIGVSLDYYKDTGGAYDITVYPIVKAWGFTTGDYHSLGQDETDALLPLVGSEKMHLEDDRLSFDRTGMMIDLGTIAKGYASDQIVSIFRAHNIQSAIINLGGNVHALGTKPDGSDWKVAIQKPDKNAKDTEYVGILSCHDAAVTTAGGYERYFEEGGQTYSHIFDPATGRPVDNDLKSASVIAKDGITADGYDTALLVMGLDKATEFWRENATEFDVILIGKDDMIYISEGIADDFETDYPTIVLSKNE